MELFVSMSGERRTQGEVADRGTEAERALLDELTRRRTESAFRELYRRHTPAIFALAVRLCGSRAEAEELTQEAWVRAVERHDSFGGRSRYGTWLAGILVNCYREAARRHVREPRPLAEEERGGAGESLRDPGTSHPAEKIDLERALRQLSEGYREVVILHDASGFTHREIAAMLGIEEGTSKSQLTRGRQRLRELLERQPESRDRGGERGTS